MFRVIFPKGETHLQKWKSALEEVRDFMIFWNRHDDIHHVIEERLGGFTGGLTTKQTLMALAAMNAVISTFLSESGDVTYIAPVTTKRIMEFKKLQLEGEDKKETVVRLARSMSPGFPYQEKKKVVSKKPRKGKGKNYPWIKGVDDMADAWMLAEAFAKVQRGEASIGQPKQAKSRKGKAGRAEVRGDEEG